MNDSQLVALNFLHFRSLGAGRTVRAIGCAGLTGGLVVGWAVNIASSRKGTTNRCAVIHVNAACVKTDTLGELSGTSSGICGSVLLRCGKEITPDVSVDNELLGASASIPPGLRSIRESSGGKNTVFGVEAAAQVVGRQAFTEISRSARA
jgi:hypothetical protein